MSIYAAPHENDPIYDRVENKRVQPDLAQYYRQFKPGYWAYVCPCCKLVFAPGFAGMPATFGVHTEGINRGEGCPIRPHKGGDGKKQRDTEGF